MMSYSDLTKEELIAIVEKLERERKDLRDRPELTFEQAAVGIAFVSGKGEIIKVNNKFAQLFGTDPVDMISSNVNDISHPDDPNIDNSEVRKVWTGELDELEIKKRYIKKDKSVFWANLTLSLAKSAKNEPNYFIAVLQDITEKKSAEDNFFKERQFTDKLINSLPGIFYLYSIDGNETQLIKWNKNHEKVTGYSTEELRGMTVFDFFSKKESPAIRAALNNIIKKGKVAIEANLKLKSGELIPHYFEGHLLSDIDEYFFLGVGLDISEQYKAQKVLRKSEEKYAAVVENSNDGIVIHKAGRVIYVNPIVEKELGYDPKEVIGKDLTDFIAPEYQKIVAQRVMDRLLGKSVPKITIVDLVRKDTSRLSVELNTSLIKYEGEKAFLVTIRDITERKIAESKLRESESKLKEAQEIAKIGHWVLDLVENSLEWSDEVYRIFGLKPQGFKATYEAFLDNIHPDDRDMTNEAYSDSLVNKKPYEIVHRLKLKDGTIKYVIEKCESTFDKNGEPLRSVGTVQDITKQIEFENKLKASEEKFRRIFETTQDGYLLADIEGNLGSANPSAIRILGYNNEEELIGKSLGRDIYTDDKQREKTLKELFINDKVLNRELIFRKKNKDEIYVECNIQAIRNTQGEVIATEGTFRDITKRKLAEEELKKYQNNLEGLVKERTIELEKSHKENLKLSKAIDHSYATVVITDKDGNIEYVNPNFTRTTGYSADEAMNQNPRILKSNQMSQSHYKEMWDTILAGEIWKGDFINKKKNGDIYWESAIISPFYNEKNEITHFVAVKEDITKRKRAEEELELFKTFTDSSTEGFGMADLDGNILYQNNALNNLLEENETPVGESLLKNYSKENQELFSGIIKQLIETSHWKGEIEVLSKNGNAVLTLQTFFLIKDSNGNPSQIAAVITDITEQKKAEEELESFKMFADGSGEGFGMADLDSNILYMNRRLLELCELNEVSPEDSFLRFYTKDSIDAINNIVMPELKSKGQWQGELEFLTANNNLLITYHNFFLIKDENGQPYRMAALVMDMTDRKRSEEELRTFKRFAESSNEGIGIADMKSNILYMNKRLLEFAEIKNVSEHVSFFKYYQGKDREIITKLILPALNTKGQWQGEIDFTSVEGKLTPTYHNFFVINDENGKPYRIATIITDITQTKKIESELKKSKEQAEEANRLKSTFLSNMSHEIRTPMNAILGFSEILSKGLKDRSQLDYLSSIQSSGKTLLQLINDILDLSKIESGKLDFSYQPANIQNLIQETINMLKVKSDEKDLQINTVISKDLPGILNIDELRIKQVLINLISNAIKFTDKGYIEVEIGCLNKKKEHLDLFIKVEDTGIGISKTNHQKIFQAFDQIEGKDSKRFEGTGLGLAITRHLVTIMNGTIELESVIGKGSIFTIVLNKVKYNEADVEFEDSIDFDPDSLEFEESSVLIVDDIKTNRDVLIGYLSSYNIKIIEAENGKEALTAIEKYKPDLVFLDLRMPVMDGYEAHKTIMKNPKWSQIPIIAITASAFDKDERKIIALGFSGYIRKPASLNEILSCLMKHLKHTAEVKHEEIAAEVIFELIDKLDEVLLEIDKKAMPVWEGIMKIRKMKDVLLLSELIVEIGKKYNAESLIDYGNELHLATQSFNIDKELKLIQQFPDFVKKLNSSSNGR